MAVDDWLAYYDRAHQNRINRWLHHVAHAVGVVGLVVLFYKLWVGMVLVAAAFPVSWAGHRLFERNTPAFFEPPAARTTGASLAKKIGVALGGIVWSAVSLGRGRP